MGRVPTHWEILSLGQVGTLTKGTGGNKEDELPTGMPCVRYGDLYTTHKYFVENARSFIAPEVADQYTKIKFGDVLFAASGETADEIGKSAVNLLRGPAYCGGDVILFRPHGHLIPRYTGYMMDCEPIVHQKATMGRGFTVYHIYGKQLKYLRIPIPPPEEQAAIVQFLDHADEQIGRYISGKERLIALLEEERQALVHQAVTRGLDPNVKLKDSGVEWLGDVPEHWDVDRLKTHVANINDSTRERKGNEPYIALEHVESWTGKIHDAGDEISFDSQVKRFQAGDVLFGKLRPYLAKVTAPNKGGVCVGEFLVLRTNQSKMASDYLELLMRSKPVIDTINASTFGAKMPRADWDFIGSLEQPIPPISEQVTILEHLDRVTSHIDAATNRARRQVELMGEYRTKLIADVVTGKINVRRI